MEINFNTLLKGEFITLRKTVPADAGDIYRWRSGSGGQFMRQPPGYSVQSQENWINSRGNDEINYIILDNKTGNKVGAIGIYDLNPDDLVANVGRLILDDEYLGKSTPYGLEALLLTYDYVFNVLHFRKITGDILGNNKAMHKLQLFLGMKQEGYLEKHVNINGQLYDLYIMSIFSEQFNKVYKKKLGFLLSSFRSNQ